VRLTFGEPAPIIYEATMESEEAAFEEAVFEQVLETRHLDQAFNHTPNGNESALLNLSGEVVGPSRSLEVFAGDTVKMEVFAKYTEPSANTYNGVVPGLAGEIAGAFGNPVVTEGGQLLSEVVDAALTGGAAFVSGNSSVPRAYLQYLLYDKNYVLQQYGYAQISSSANGISAPFDHLVLDVPIDKSGFIYIYTANETDDPAVNAYFDDLKITHKQMVVQADDYYPFGLSIEALSYQRFGGKGNDYLYNNKELERSLDLNWYDFGARFYDPQLGRWHVVDPLAENFLEWSPYNYAFNNPVRFTDPDGTRPEDKTITDRAIEQLGFRSGFEITVNKEDGTATIVKTSVSIQDADSKTSSFSVTQTTFGINADGQVDHVEQSITSFEASLNEDGEINVSDGVDQSDNDLLKGKFLDVFANNLGDAQKFVDNEPLVGAFANVMQNQKEKAINGELPFGESSAGDRIEQVVNFAADAIEGYLVTGPGQEPISPRLKNVDKARRFFVPMKDANRATKRFNRAAQTPHVIKQN